MDRLTLLTLAESAPRTAVVYVTPISIVKVAPVLECAECANKFVESSRLLQQSMECYRIATRADVKKLPCNACGQLVTLPDS